jgi:REP element-mobilizing transposase RayT
MRSRYKIVESEGIYFVTSTIVEWIPVFTSAPYFEIVTQSLAYCRQHKGLRLYAYVILDNHLHLVADVPDLSGVLQAFKRHTAKAIIELARTTKRDWLLNQFAYYRKKYKQTSDHQVWQEGFYPKLIHDDEMMYQKIRYIHDNPLRRMYVDAPEHWRYSSARNYMLNDETVLEIDRLPAF